MEQLKPFQYNGRDWTGTRFGKLVVLKFIRTHLSGMAKRDVWLCRCDCGTEQTFKIVDLTTKTGSSKSCGCLKVEFGKKNNLRHGHSVGGKRSTEYNSWTAMKDRCYSLTHQHRAEYAGRGITVCERWINSFDNFLADIGPKPSNYHSLDRINNDGNYEPSNCRWADAVEQANNRRPRRIK